MRTLSPSSNRLLRNPLVDLMVGPHGIDRYLELIRPTLTVHDARARVVDVSRQTPRSVTLTIDPNRAFTGFRAGQFVKVGVEIDGRRYTRTYSPTISEHNTELLELTITVREGGIVGSWLREHARPGLLLHLSEAAGDFLMPERRPGHVALISGGSGVTPTIAMLRTLMSEGHRGRIDFVHYGRTPEDFLYRDQVEAIAGRHPNVVPQFIATRTEGRRFDVDTVPASAHALVCGPPALIDAVRGVFPDATAETFTPPTLDVSGAAAAGTLRFLASAVSAPIAAGTLLEQAEAAGLSPEYGCRMGICHGCTCTKTAGTVKNVLTGVISDEEDEEIQICISVPVTDVALNI
ncbi:MAG TPA: iron-sulfur cluster-binding domain-containing protein [Solirubrobacteraceae bacterium]|nr:iron-sulfur cluster-binding domain-containing protein [Solirubrobacteraceae bacterium]